MVGIGKRNILADGAIEKHVLLQHHADLAPQPGDIDHGEIDAVDQDAPALRHVEALDELRERALARTRRGRRSQRSARRDAEANIVQDFRPIDAIAERDMFKSDLAADRRKRGARRT